MMQKLVAFVLGVVFAVQIVVADTATVNGITWIYTVVNGVASVGGGSSSSTAVPTSTYGSIAIPSTLGGYRVTSIGRQAFYGCSKLKCVTIPDSVTNIGPSAFYGCRGLDSVTIPGSVSRIENWSFAYCNGLTNVTLSGSVTSIGEAAFWNCSNLASVVIPDSVTNIENEAFYGCSGLTHLILGEGLTNIGGGAFWNCGSLTDVTIPDSVTHVGTSAFAGCNELLFNTNTIAGVRLVDGWVVGYTDSLTGELDLTGIRGIGRSAFSGCRELTGVVMPSSVISVVYGAFYGCNSLIKVNMPESVTAIEENAFADCTSLESVSIPEGVTDVGDFAFSMCSNLVGVTIPNTLTNIGERAFQGCSSLTRILIPDRVTSIGDDAFYGCTGLTDVSLPANFTSVWAFGDCTNVVKLSAPYLPRGVGSGKLSSVVVPEDVTNIVDSAFYGCSSLTNVIIPSSVKRIGNSAFAGCSNLTEVVIPNSVWDVGAGAFANCTNLRRVEAAKGLKGTLEAQNAFEGCPANLEIVYVETATISNVTAKQRYPWNGKVDITYTLTGDVTAGLPPWNMPFLSVTASNRVDGATYTAEASALSGDTGTEEGAHHVVWDMDAQGLKIKSDEMVFTVAYQGYYRYCVIDLSGGASVSSYPVTYVASVPSGGFNTDEYKTTKLVLRLIEPGSFKMRGQYDVTLTKPFYCGVFEVTQKQYELVTGSNPCSSTSYGKGDSYPVHYVSYDMIRGSSAGAGWPGSSAVDNSSFLGKLRAKTCVDFDLPTEAQWEYACRAGTTTTYSYGDSADGNYMWYSSNSSSKSHAAGMKQPNAWGLYDMHGNVWEWCLDWNGSLSSGVTDPVGSSSGSYRVLRGGCWGNDAGYCTSSNRYFYYPSDEGYYDGRSHGFRLVRTLSN